MQRETIFKFYFVVKLLFTCFLFISFQELYAQEICDNEKDDDGDGLVDINDPDCQCHTQIPANILLNASFEEYNHCLIPTAPFSQNFDMMKNWQFGSTDPSGSPIFYLNEDCPEFADMVYNYPKLTVQDGKAIVSILSGGTPDIPENETEKIYVTQCLQKPLSKNKQYTLTLYAGSFLNNLSIDSVYIDDIYFTVGIFGHPDCNAVPFGVPFKYSGCPVNYGGWSLLGTSNVFKFKNAWAPLKIDLTIPEDINVIAIGTDCSSLLDRTIFFLDDLQLAETKDFDFQYMQVQSGTPCEGSYQLTAPVFNNGSYQWYRNGIALAGQNGNDYNVPDSNAQGMYNVRITKNGTCKISEPLTLQVSDLLQLKIPSDTVICKHDTLHFGKAITGIKYSWRGNQGNIVTIFKPGIYNITASDTLGCTRNFSINVQFTACAACTVYVPTAFTPNGDGLNDVLKGYINCSVDEYRLQIFNRWGQKIFESNVVNDGWDGTFKGSKVPSGVYTYLVNFKNSSFEKNYKIKKGSVMIIR